MDSFVFRKYSEIVNQYEANLKQNNFDIIFELENERKIAEQRFDLFLKTAEPFTMAIGFLGNVFEILNEGNQEHLEKYLQHKEK